MKKGELKNRLRRRTADKLYDLARSTSRVPAQLPAEDPAGATNESACGNGKMHAKQKPGSTSTQ